MKPKRLICINCGATLTYLNSISNIKCYKCYYEMINEKEFDKSLKIPSLINKNA